MGSNNKRLTTEQFITKAMLIHGDKYDYSKVDYVNNSIKVIIICKEHGEFEQKPANHLKGANCRKCTGTLKLSLNEFISNANSVHNYKYDYSKTVYTVSKNKVTITCPIHGDFEQKANHHLQGHGCSYCGGSNISNTKEFIEKANKVHNNKYDYSLVEYKNSKSKITIICPIHGEFQQTPISHIKGSGCASCMACGFDINKPAYLYYLKVTTNDNQILYKIGITNRTVDERFNLTDLSKIEIVKQKLYEKGIDALAEETRIKRKFKKYQYKGSPVLSSGNTELFTEDIMLLHHNISSSA